MMTVPDADTTRKLKHRRTLPVANKANLVPPFRLQRMHHSPRQAGRLDSPPPAYPTSAPAEFTSPSPVKPTFVSPAEQQGGASRKVEFLQNVDHFGSQKWDHVWSQKWDQRWSHFLPRFVKTESGHIGNPITARQKQENGSKKWDHFWSHFWDQNWSHNWNQHAPISGTGPGSPPVRKLFRFRDHHTSSCPPRAENLHVPPQHDSRLFRTMRPNCPPPSACSAHRSELLFIWVRVVGGDEALSLSSCMQ